MDKIRVNDLARELKIDNKELLRHINELGIDARSNLSTLNSDEANMVREKLKDLQSVEETRVASRVIRRRRKVTEEVEPEADEAFEEPEDKPEDAPEGVPPVARQQLKAVDDAAEAEAAAPVEHAPEKVEALHAKPAEETQAAEGMPPAKVEAAKESAPVGETEEKSLRADNQAQRGPVADAGRAPKDSKAQRDPREPRDAREPKKPRKPADTPARIISRPDPAQQIAARPAPGAGEGWRGPARTGAPARPGGPRPAMDDDNRRPVAGRPPRFATPAVDVEAPMSDKEARGPRGKKKGRRPGQADDSFSNGRPGVKRKEIFDKQDLYDTRGPKMRRGAKKPKKTELTTPKAIKRRIKVGATISAAELAKRLGVKAAELIGKLMQLGMMVTANQVLDIDEAILIASEFGFEVERADFEEDAFLEQIPDKPEDLMIRPPVVTIMGHVDHGKTSLLDSIRRSHVTDEEAGGITQHIGAYDVTLQNGGHVVFVDTPGHAAFTQMRARGAQVTDVVVLVVAADDGVMQQTKEAISHSRAANVPIVVAINKIDKPSANPEQVRRELSEQGLVSEDWGGDTIMMEVSAKTGKGIEELLEMLLLQSEVLELKANPSKPARGHILEAKLDRGRGPVATVLVQEGTLKPGDFFVSGAFAGKVRALQNDLGQVIESAGPSIPVEVQGLSGVPEAGDEFVVVENEKTARQIAQHRSFKKREAELSSKGRLSLEGLFEQMKEGEVKELNLVIKADVQGSVEALVEALQPLGNEQVKIHIIHAAAGAITETDIMLASASNAVLIGFNVRPDNKVAEIARTEKIDVRTYEVIYQILDDITAALTGMLAPIREEEVIGRAEVRDTFSVPKLGVIAGCGVTSGKVERNALVRLLRDGVVVANTKVSSLRRFKEDVKEVTQGYECGIGLENYNDIKLGDEMEFYVIREKAAHL